MRNELYLWQIIKMAQKYDSFTIEEWRAILPALKRRNARRLKRLEAVELEEVRKQEVISAAENYYSRLKQQRQEQRRY